VFTESPVLVLNQNYEPLDVCRTRRAVLLVYRGKAEMLEDGSGFLYSVGGRFAIPSVIRLATLVKRPRPRVRLSRGEVFNRDNYTCQYCGRSSFHLTIDHVKPKYQGGPHTWENVVSACVPCNRHKAGRTPEQASMKLLTKPVVPRQRPGFTIPHRYLESVASWRKYLAA